MKVKNCRRGINKWKVEWESQELINTDQYGLSIPATSRYFSRSPILFNMFYCRLEEITKLTGIFFFLLEKKIIKNNFNEFQARMFITKQKNKNNRKTEIRSLE